MVKFIVYSALAILLFSCKKEPITPGNYTTTAPLPDTSHWQNQYGNGGTLPTWGNGNSNNELVGTKWVLTNLQTGFSTMLPIDTIRFISNTYYTINSGAVKTYQFSSGVASNSKTLTLNYHFPFGSGNYSGEVASTFVTDSVMNNVEFKNIQNTATIVRAWFVRI